MADRIIATNVNIAPLVGGISSGVSINSPTLIRSSINSPTINRGFFNSPAVKNELTFGPSFFSSSRLIGSKKLNFTKQGFVGTIYDSRTGGSFLIGANHIDPSPNLSPGSNNISPNRYFSPSHSIVISGPSLHNTPFSDIANCPSKVGANINIGGAYESPAANSPFSNNNQTISINSGQTLFFPPGSSNKIDGGFTKKNAFINVRPSTSPGMSTIGVGINSPTNSPNVGFHVDTGSRFDCPVSISNAAPGSKSKWAVWRGGKRDWITNPTPGNSPTFGINSSPDTSQNGSPLGYSPGFNVEITASSLFNCPVHYTAPVTFHSPTTFHATPTFTTTLKATKIKYAQLRGTGMGAGPGGTNYISGGYDQGSTATLYINANSPRIAAGANNLYIGTGGAGGAGGPGVTDAITIGGSHNTTSFVGHVNASPLHRSSVNPRVGIGVDCPSHILQVVGNAKFDDTPTVPGLTISSVGVLKAPTIQFSSVGSTQVDTGNKISGFGVGRLAAYAGDAPMFDFIKEGFSTVGSSYISHLLLNASEYIWLGRKTRVESFVNGSENSITFDCPNVNFNYTPNFKEGILFGSPQTTHSNYHLIKPAGGRTGSGEVGASIKIQGANIGGGLNYGGDVYIDGGSPSALRIGQATAGNIRIGTERANQIIIGHINQNGDCPAVNINSKLIVNAPATDFNSTVTFPNTPNLPGIHLTSNTPAFRSKIGVQGTSDNATFNTVTLTTASATALTVQPLGVHPSRARLTISNTDSPSVINGTFNGSPTFAGPVSFNDTPNVVGLNITGAKAHVRNELQLGTGNSPTFAALKLTPFGDGTNSPKVLFKLDRLGTGLPVFADNAAATSGGLAIGQVYRASGSGSPVAGTLMIRF